ncbi:MATE family efflux transporter [Chitinophagaceae bacterium LB-8]|uniref:Multidrug-efflux transporter n=1 Tax=Paraflavisolibacter caeni TaxID=2982496 RepID=A0A9X3BIJ0_9BACT|nr:MATE family efflux transporter [Paraflavisolibacter caeni]MCU7551467.1 MATE family efflux transporter [Paraflavisolibacter caeni]
MVEKLQVDVTRKQILKIALPISLALLVPQFNFIINNVFLGHLSEQALAAASITGVYYLVFASVGYGLNNGLQALISRRAGENKPGDIGKIFNQGVLVSMLIAVTGILLTYFLAPVILRTTIHSKETFEMSIRFLQIRIWGLPFLYIYQMRNALLVGTNQSKYLVAGTVAEATANVFFDYTLIFGKLGFPAFGFNGAAFASVIAEFFGMFVIFLVIYQKGIGRQYAIFKDLKWDSRNAKLIADISGPLVFQHAISIISWVFFYILIEHHGSTSLAVSNTMRNVFGFFGVFIWAFASTTNSMVSNVIGQGKKELVIPLINKIALLSLSVALIIALLLNLFPGIYLSIYGQNEEFIRAGTPVLRLVATIMVLMSVSSIWLNAVTGTGNSRVTFLIELFAITLYCSYVYIVLEVNKLSIFWGWASELLYWSCMLALSFLYIKSGRWKLKKL